MRTILTSNLIKYLEGEKAKAKANVEIYLRNPAGIGEHPDVLEALRSALSKVSQAEEDIQTLKREFIE